MKQVFILFLFLTSIALYSQVKVVPQTGHNSWFEMSVSPDGKRLVTGDQQGKIIFWDLTKYKSTWQSYAHKSAITKVEWRGDNRYFMTCSLDSTLQIWDSETMKNSATYHHFSKITAAAFNPATNVLAYGDSEGRLLIFDLLTREEFLRIDAKSQINSLQWTENGFILFAATSNNGVMAFEMDKGKKVLDMPIKGQAQGLQLTPGNKLLLIHTGNRNSELYEPLTGKVLGSLDHAIASDKNGATNYIWPVASYNSSFIFDVDKNKRLTISHLKSSIKNIYNSSILTRDICNMVSSPDNNFVVIADGGGGIYLCYFNESDWQHSKQLYWRKLLFEPERIYQSTFLESDYLLCMKGMNLYNFNLRNGDLSRRDDDSSKISNSSYNVQLFALNKMKDSIYFYSDQTKNILYKIKDQVYNKRIYQFAFSQDTNVVAMVDDDNFIIYNIETKSIIRKEKVDPNTFVLFNGHLNNYFITASGKTMRFIQTASGEIKTFSDYPREGISWLTCDSKMNYLLGSDFSGQFHQWNFKGSKKNSVADVLKQFPSRLFDINPNDKNMILIDDNNKMHLIDTKSWKLIKTYSIKHDNVVHLAYNKSGTLVALTDIDGIVHLYDADLNNLLCHIITSPNNGLIAYNDNNYYIATKEAAQNLALVDNKKVLGFEHMDLIYNRPDKVLQAIGYADEQLVAAYERAYQKRMNRVNFVEQNSFDLPEISISNFSSIPLTTDENFIDINLAAQAKEKLKLFNVWVNGVPLFGVSGKTITKPGWRANLSVKIPLLFGNNNIAVSCVDAKGAESEKQEFRIISKKSKASRLFLVAIGVSQYNDSRYNLSFADKDAKDLLETFKQSKAFTETKSLLLTNKDVTRDKLTSIRAFLEKSNPEDVVIVFLAGHGLRDKNFDYFFATHDIDFDDPAKRGIADHEIESLLDHIPALRKVMFFDTCLSGEVDKDEVEQSIALNTDNTDVTFRNVGVGLRNKKVLGIENSLFLMKEIYNDLRHGSGATVMSSSGGAEYAMESKEWKNGLFTYCVLSALKDKETDTDKNGQIELDELGNYVTQKVKELSRGKQYPDFRSSNMELNFRLW